jgi:thymidylate kinase
LKLAAKDPARFRVVDASGSIEQAHEQVMDILLSNLEFQI